jgi:SAM-dependent methyltransferase
MPNDLVLPASAIPFVLLQRPGHQRYSTGWWSKLPIPYFPTLWKLESRTRRRAVTTQYDEAVARDYEQLRPHLPAEVDTVLDIGCGMAGIDARLHRHYAARPPQFVLLDKSTVTPGLYYAYEEKAAAYSSLDAARATLNANGVARDRITCLEADDENRIAVDGPVDLVISLFSWGFHYPVSTYIPEVLRILAPDGIVILDSRTDTPGREALEQSFSRVSVVSEWSKATRFKAER